jgi:hypothetical protein
MALGIMDTIGLAASLVFAIPVGVFALQKLLAGEQLFGGILLLVAVLMVAIPQYLTTPQDIPGKVAGKVVGGAVADPDESERTEE